MRENDLKGKSLLRRIKHKLESNERFSGIKVSPFSQWIEWEQRNEEIEGIGEPGLYVLAHLTKEQTRTADQLDKTTIYFGETGTSLKQRLYAFHRTAFAGGSGHGGAENYKRGNFPLAQQNRLHVSVCYLELGRARDVPIKDVTRMLETCLKGAYFLKWGDLPRCNGA